MKSKKWWLCCLFLVFISAGCLTSTPTLVIQPTQSITAETTATPSPSNIASLPAWCIDLRQQDGLPASKTVRNSSIVYEAYAFDVDKHVINPVWEVSLSDGEEKLLSVKFPNIQVDDNEYDVMGNGFSLVSPDQKFVAVWGHWFESKNADDTYSLIIRNKDNGQEIEIFRSSPGERIDGNWSPDGGYFVFTWYKNIPEYYSVVYSVNADGSGLKELTRHIDKETLERPYWSPNGQKIAIPVWSKSGGMDIMVINFQTDEIKRFKVSPIIRLYPSSILDDKPQSAMLWSSDSQWFVYISQYKHSGIEILNTENGSIYCVENEKIFGIEKLVWRYDSP
ncbi:MAG: hypothetical protein M1282_18895 [Chloroflexi bacterium]|nr:hypothetical protein [Chloroflexota bacterium]